MEVLDACSIDLPMMVRSMACIDAGTGAVTAQWTTSGKGGMAVRRVDLTTMARCKLQSFQGRRLARLIY
jgi:hypothetical protein